MTDDDTAMVDVARSQLSSFGNVAVEVTDVAALPFAAASFHAVTSYLMLHHVISRPEALAETARVLRSGGAIGGYDLTDTRNARWIHRADGSPHRIVAADELREGLAVVGFTEITVRPSFAGHLMRFHAHKPTGG